MEWVGGWGKLRIRLKLSTAGGWLGLAKSVTNPFRSSTLCWAKSPSLTILNTDFLQHKEPRPRGSDLWTWWGRPEPSLVSHTSSRISPAHKTIVSPNFPSGLIGLDWAYCSTEDHGIWDKRVRYSYLSTSSASPFLLNINHVNGSLSHLCYHLSLFFLARTSLATSLSPNTTAACLCLSTNSSMFWVEKRNKILIKQCLSSDSDLIIIRCLLLPGLGLLVCQLALDLLVDLVLLAPALGLGYGQCTLD